MYKSYTVYSIWTKSLKSILRFAKHNAFKNPLIPKQKKLYGYKIVAVGPIIFQNRISNFKCFLTTFSTVKTLKKQLQKKRLKIWIWISNFFETETLGHGLSGTVLTLLWNPVVATQSGWACSSIPTMAASHCLKCSCTRFRETSLTATTHGPLV